MRVRSIFKSINGEVCVSHQGSICTFIRLAGCNLRCAWCDTKYAQLANSGEEQSWIKVFNRVKGHRCHNVTITGGEPLLQKKELEYLVDKLISYCYSVSIETNGSLKIPSGWPVHWVADVKCPSSKENTKWKYCNYENLSNQDFVKFVIQDKIDFQYAASVMGVMKDKMIPIRFAFSPTSPLNAAKLIDWMKEYQLNDAIFSLQIHKILYPLAQAEGIEV